MRAASLIIALAPLLAACQTNPGVDTALPTASGTYLLTEIDGAVAQWPVTLGFGDAGRIFGQAPCNLYFGTASREGSAIAIGAIGMTEMACMDQSQMQGDATFAALMVQMDRVVEAGPLLTLTGAGHVMVFRAQ